MVILALATTFAPAAPAAGNAVVPRQPGQCVRTRVAGVYSRLDGDPASGSAVRFANGLHQVGYDVVPAIAASRPGDPVRVCLISLPRHCPPGDSRGKTYRTTNLRTGAAWRAPDAEHGCGGA